jgi:hypothetical protein
MVYRVDAARTAKVHRTARGREWYIKKEAENDAHT